MYGVIYKAANKVNGKYYIGQAVNLKRRISVHKRLFVKLKSRFYSAIICHGWENFIWEKVDCAKTKNSLNKKEKHWIKSLNTLHPNGYNLRPGGHGGGIKGQDSFKYKELDEQKIIDLYVNKNMTAVAIAKIFNVGNMTIAARLKKHNIKIKKYCQKVVLDEKKIVDLYVNKNMTATEIGKIMGVVQTTILKRLKDNGILIKNYKR